MFIFTRGGDCGMDPDHSNPGCSPQSERTMA